MDSAVKVKHLTVSYHNKPVLWDVNLDVPAGVMAGIVGPNGAGKSTFIKSLPDYSCWSATIPPACPILRLYPVEEPTSWHAILSSSSPACR
ncbi:ATP-binding cassette domain-containing protein, partial [Halomonas piscis]|uniref:ATP-binding cassette domain-containing protein n=1 Tax=Halomonas piscis TaxID=3031727 RepID=UPI00289644F9